MLLGKRREALGTHADPWKAADYYVMSSWTLIMVYGE